jgi:hypothetical protein
MIADREVLRGLADEIEAIIRRNIVLRLMGQESFMEGFEEAAAEIAAFRAPQNDGAAASEWRPIETAPKDGTAILLWSGIVTRVGWWLEEDGIWLVGAGSILRSPTHWMPLPKRPASATEAVGRDRQGSVHEGAARRETPALAQPDRLPETATGGETAWPNGCIKPGSCSRHRGCMYAQSSEQCRHFGKDLTAEIEAARPATTSNRSEKGDRTDA